jgi:predicted phage terminase large subunit-like protein
VIFRRTYPELRGPGSLWEEMRSFYPRLGAEMVDSALTCTFESGAAIVLSHMQHETDADRWKGRQLAFIGFDELDSFTEAQFWNLFACLRTTSGVATRIIATTNPNADSWVLELVRPYLTPEGYPDPLMAGRVLWFGRTDGQLRWWQSESAALADGVHAVSFTFIPSMLSDNAILMRKDPKYAQVLNALPPVERARYLYGNWFARKTSGSYFQRAWFPLVQRPPAPADVLRVFRAWDLAATPVATDLVPGAPRVTAVTEGTARDADWSRGVKLAQVRSGAYVILDVVSARDTPGAIEYLVRTTAIADGPHCRQVMWQDPAQAGVHQIELYSRALRGIAQLATCRSMNPLDVAQIVSGQAWAGKIAVLQGAHWEGEFFRELEGFPRKGIHDDIVSALALGVVHGLENPHLVIAHSTEVLPSTEVPRPSGLRPTQPTAKTRWTFR